MARNDIELVQQIGANLQDRLPLDLALPAKFVTLLGDIDAAEVRRRAASDAPVETSHS